MAAWAALALAAWHASAQVLVEVRMAGQAGFEAGDDARVGAGSEIRFAVGGSHDDVIRQVALGNWRVLKVWFI